MKSRFEDKNHEESNTETITYKLGTNITMSVVWRGEGEKKNKTKDAPWMGDQDNIIRSIHPIRSLEYKC